jgi:hypothetical protein
VITDAEYLHFDEADLGAEPWPLIMERLVWNFGELLEDQFDDDKFEKVGFLLKL